MKSEEYKDKLVSRPSGEHNAWGVMYRCARFKQLNQNLMDLREKARRLRQESKGSSIKVPAR